MGNKTVLPVVFLMGPTAAGKTELAISLADRFDVSIISVDSAMIYQSMDIGSAKPDCGTLQRYPHQLIDVCDPAESFSVAQFRDQAMRCIEEAVSNGKIPLLVGGTMLYFKALLKGLADIPQGSSELRQQLTARIKEEGVISLHQELAQVDPQSAMRLQPTDTQRVQRALEVFLHTGKTLTQFWQEQTDYVFPYPVLPLALMPEDRQQLHQRIAMRYDHMIEQGFEEEALVLYKRGDLSLELPSMRCVGYKQMWQYFAGELDESARREKTIIATRQLAKRQYTWLRSWQDLEILQGGEKNIFKKSLNLLTDSLI